MDSFPLAGLTVSASDDLATLIVTEKGGGSKRFDLKESFGITLKAGKRKFQVHRKNPIKNQAFHAIFNIPRSSRIRIKLNFVVVPERNVIVITDFDETLEASATCSVNINTHHLQLRRTGESLEIFAGTTRTIVGEEPEDEIG